MSKNYDPYEEVGEIMGTLEAYESIIETMILNGKNGRANCHLREATTEIRHALSDLSDAMFDITTEPLDDMDGDD